MPTCLRVATFWLHGSSDVARKCLATCRDMSATCLPRDISRTNIRMSASRHYQLSACAIAKSTKTLESVKGITVKQNTWFITE